MNMTMTKTLLTTLLATLSATLCATTAQAAALSLVAGSANGSLAVRAGVNDQTVLVDASVAEQSGAGYLLGTGGQELNRALTPTAACRTCGAPVPRWTPR